MGCQCCKNDSRKKKRLERERQQQLALEKLSKKRKVEAAKKIQAWWRGILVRQALLIAALSAWIIQSWWRTILHRQVQKRRLALLRIYVIEEEAVVKLQSWVRMWQCRQYFYQMNNMPCVLQSSQSSLTLQNHDILQIHYRFIPKEPEFHIEILSI